MRSCVLGKKADREDPDYYCLEPPIGVYERNIEKYIRMHDRKDHEHEKHGSAGPLTFKTDLAIWTAVVFLLLLAVLKKFAWGKKGILCFSQPLHLKGRMCKL